MISEKHRVLIFGEKVFGLSKPKLSIDYCDVDVISFPDEYEQLSRLVDYDLVILDYSAFLERQGRDLWTIYKLEQEIFEKQMLAALKTGTYFCILHYDEDVPSENRKYSSSSDGYMSRRGIARCMDSQIGFRWLKRSQIRPLRMSTPVIDVILRRNEFKLYQEHWGASKNYFKPYGKGKFGDVMFSLGDEHALGFALSVRRGKILYLPCQRDFDRPGSIEECLTTLVNSIITYLTRSSAEIPPWAEAPLFSREAELQAKLSDLQSKIDALHENLQPYQIAKGVAFLSEYQFEEAVPKFFTTHLGLATLRHEEFKEDFWILNSQSEKIVIAETKSHARGLKKGDIYSLYKSREANGLDDTFPALLVVNAHLNTKSWKEKLRPLPPQDYQLAVQNNILVVRIEDLLFFWNSIVEGRHSQDELLSVILEKNGWMEVQKDGDFRIHR